MARTLAEALARSTPVAARTMLSEITGYYLQWPASACASREPAARGPLPTLRRLARR